MEMKDVKAITIPEGQVKKITDSNGNVIWGNPSDFPYRRLEYIYFSGTDEYILEDFSLANKERKMILEYDLSDFVNNMTLMGQYDATVTDGRRRMYCVRYNTSNNQLRAAIGGTFGGTVNPSLNTKYKSTVEYTSASAPTLKVKVEQGSTTLVDTTITQTGQTSISGFGAIGKVGCSTEKPNSSSNPGPTNYWHGKLYKYEKYNTNTGATQNNQYPAQRKSDGVCGLYDVQNGNFYAMTGTVITSGAAGPVVDEYWDLTSPD